MHLGINGVQKFGKLLIIQKAHLSYLGVNTHARKSKPDHGKGKEIKSLSLPIRDLLCTVRVVPGN